jgi:hypothetical protein
VILALFAIGDDRRTSRFEPFDTVANGFVVELIEVRAVAIGVVDISAAGRGRLPIGSVGIMVGFGSSGSHCPSQATVDVDPAWFRLALA